MHGRLKVKTTDEQLKSKLLEKENKIRIFRQIQSQIIDARNHNENSIDILNLMNELLLKAPEWNLFWNYRREILINLNLDENLLNKELDLTERCLRENPKAYAVWHHRSWTLSHLSNANWSQEIDLCNKALKQDERNFHCWDHRRFVVDRGQIDLQHEFSFSEHQILDNISNYSSWHYRSSLLFNKSADFNLEHELDLINNSIFTDPLDQSPWFYLRWLMVYNRKKPFIRELYVNKRLKQIVLIVSEPVSHRFMSGVRLSINEIEENPTWKPALSDGVSSVWLYSLEDVDLDRKISIGITRDSTGDCDWRCELDSKAQESLIRVDTDINRILCENVSEEMPLEVLSDELKVVRELLELEPSNKWVLLTIVSILRIVDPLASRDEIFEKFERLQQIDPIRSAFYREAWSKYRIECELISLYKSHKRAVLLANQHLTGVSHLDWMTLMTEIDLSGNHLTSIPEQFRYLVCLTSLNLSANRIRSLNNLRSLTLLQHLNVQNNRLNRYEDLEPVFYCTALVSLNIKGNAVSQLANLTELMAKHPSSKLHLQSISIIYDKSVL